MSANMAVRRSGSMLIMRQNKQTPTSAEWDEFLQILRDCRKELPKLKLLVITSGGGPDPSQRKRLEETLGGAAMRVAVVSDNLKVRFVASTIALFHKDHRSFLTTELANAFEHLGLELHERGEAKTVLRQLGELIHD